ncbi:MAG: patatin-like phospholipase family protein [Actinomycetota bacterium]|nr:patatin-like phospholipase family protein [Actinomycetota bacterium]
MDWIDEADGVFRGGGVKGIALAGALEGFAEHETKPVRRWVNVAGASAGAIIACYLALDHTAEEMVALLKGTDFSRFEDFPRGSRLLGAGNLMFNHGLARGREFERWFDEVLDGATFDRVKKKPEGDKERDWKLKLIAVDVTNRDLLVLPDDLVRYRLPGQAARIDPDGFKIASAARMSMAIPYFFEPVELDHEKKGRSVIIDGGTLSNFPVWLFDVDPAVVGRPPARPTFGLTLSGGRGFAPSLKAASALVPWSVRFAFEIFHTATEAWDERFVSQSTRVRTFAVDADDVGTTDFTLSEQKQQLLLANGRSAAREFLAGFRLEDYMNTFHAKPAQ